MKGKLSEPKYITIMKSLSSAIKDGIYNENNCLPSERELTEIYAVSRITIRKALSELEKNDIIYSIQGKGYFINSSKISQQLGKLASFSEDMISRGLHPSSIILALVIIPADKTVAEFLNINYADDVIMLKRLRLANNEPMAIETAYLNIQYKEEIINNFSENKSLYTVLKDKYHLLPQKAFQSFEIKTLDAWEATLLNEDKNNNCIFMQRRTYDNNNCIFEYVESKYRSSKFKFFIELMIT